MKTSHIIASWLIVVGLVTAPYVFSDDEREHWKDEARYSTGVAFPANPVYQNECGSCHMAYPPGLLPERSWRKLMAELHDHFGDNAELDTANHQAITDFLVSNSADKSAYRRSRRFALTDGNDTTAIRISATPYFRREHHEIPARLVTGNPEVRSFSHCNACHTKATEGSFRERDILIPGYGRWDD